jgi:O-antigen ligase
MPVSTGWPEQPQIRHSARGGLAGRLSGGFCAAITSAFAPMEWLATAKVRRFLLAVAVLNISFSIGIHLGYREELGDLGSVGGLNITLNTIALAGLYLPRLVAGRSGSSDWSMGFWRSSVPLALYLVFAVLSLLAAGDIIVGLYEVFFIFELFLLHFYLVNSVASRDDVLLVIRYLLIGLAAQALLMIALACGLAEVGFLNAETIINDPTVTDIAVTRQINVFSLKGRIDENKTGLNRVGGSLGSANDAADYLSGAIGVALGVLFTSLGRRYKILAGVAVGLGTAALVLTFSRGGWMAFVLTLAIVGFFGWRNSQIGWKRPLAAAFVLFLVVGTVFSESISTRLTEDDKGSAESRVPLMKLAALIIADHPLLGAGANNFPLVMQPYLTQGFSGQLAYSVHNKYLLVLSETGPGGLVTFVWFLVAMIRRGMRCWHYKDPLLSPLALGCVAAVVGDMLHMFVDIFRGAPSLNLLCVISALLAVLDRATAPGGGCVKARRQWQPA